MKAVLKILCDETSPEVERAVTEVERWRMKVQECDQRLGDAKTALRNAEEIAVSAILATGGKSVTVQGGSAYIKTQVHCNVTRDGKYRLGQWLAERGYNLGDFEGSKLDMQKLGQVAFNGVSDDELPDGTSVFRKRGIVIRRRAATDIIGE